MKKLTLTLCGLVALMTAAYAGSEAYSGKEMKQVAPAPCLEFYGDREFNISVWGAVGFAGHDHPDTFLVDELAGGGGIDLKYFFNRYLGIGLQGFGLFNFDNDYDYTVRELAIAEEVFETELDPEGNDSMGAVSATFTLRYPFPCHPFSPYLVTGVGAYFGGEEQDRAFSETDVDDENEDFFLERGGETDVRFGSQIGAGVEWRFSPRISAISDFTWHWVDGKNNNFGMVKAGVNFAF